MNDLINKKITTIFQSILGKDFNEDMNSNISIDSIAYVELLIAFQNEFKIKFSTQDFFSLRSVEKIKETLLGKLDKN
jgi:acyl carrier protein